MDMIYEIWDWTSANYKELLINFGLLIAALEGLARLTPTKKDDSALERVGGFLRKIMDLLRIPNLKKEPGKLLPSKHEKRD